jgi:hypothetical protein
MRKKLLVLLAVVIMMAASGSAFVGTEAADTEVANKVTICHMGAKTLQVGMGAVPAHLNHGDTLGPCP